MSKSIVCTSLDPINTYIRRDVDLVSELIWNLAEHFREVDGLSDSKAWALALKALKIEPAKWDSALHAHTHAKDAARRDLARFMRRAQACAATYMAEA